MILVMEEKKAEPEPVKEPETNMVECDCCGELCDESEIHVLNVDSESEMNLCEECFESAEAADDICYCNFCESYLHIDNLAMNPVTKEYDLCPCCGNKLGE
jgi:hypothetical protein